VHGTVAWWASRGGGQSFARHNRRICPRFVSTARPAPGHPNTAGLVFYAGAMSASTPDPRHRQSASPVDRNRRTSAAPGSCAPGAPDATIPKEGPRRAWVTLKAFRTKSSNDVAQTLGCRVPTHRDAHWSRAVRHAARHLVKWALPAI